MKFDGACRDAMAKVMSLMESSTARSGSFSCCNSWAKEMSRVGTQQVPAPDD